jgi:hypothetical protein
VSPPVVKVSRATTQSAAEISRLLEANSTARGGELHGDWSEDVIRCWLNDGMQTFIAVVDHSIRGVLLTSEPFYIKSGPAMEMLKHLEKPEAFYVYGPVCIAREARGSGLLARLREAAVAFYCERRAVLFINQKNQASLVAHGRLGMERLGLFQFGGQNYFRLVSTVSAKRDI